MSFTISDGEGKRVLKLSGAVGMGEGEALKEALVELLGSSEAAEVDLAGVTEIDICTLQLFLAAKKSAEKSGTDLTWVEIPKSCRDMAVLAGMPRLLGIPCEE